MYTMYKYHVGIDKHKIKKRFHQTPTCTKIININMLRTNKNKQSYRG